MKISFSGRILITGAGAVSQCLQLLLVRHFDIDFSKVTIIDALDNRNYMKEILDRGARFIQLRINTENYNHELSKYLSSGDLLIDLTVNLESGDLIEWCQNHNVLYINTSIEWWEPYAERHSKQLIDRTLYVRHMAIRERAKKWPKNGPTAIVEHGANPGLVSHWTKRALVTIAEKIVLNLHNIERRKALELALSEENFPNLAMLTGTKVIHISEHDTQISNNPKKRMNL